MRLIYWLFVCVFAFGACDAPAATLIRIQGYVGADQLALIQGKIDQAPATEPLVLDINSTSGDLVEVLKFAQNLYERKRQNSRPVVAYLSTQVLGPAAILPFLADEIITTPYISWGAIPQQSESSVALNVLRNQVVSLINPSNPKAEMLRMLARAMVDTSVFVVKDGGNWKVVTDLPAEAVVISQKGETLVLSHDQLDQLDIVQRFMTEAELFDVYAIKEKAEEQAAGPSPLMTRLAEHIKFVPDVPQTIGRILIDDRTSGITQGTWLYVKSALDHYKKTKPTFIILELNTPGGVVYSSQLISDALKEMDTQYGIPVVAYINNWAISAGAMLAYSCRFIVIAKDAAMGAAEPILQTNEGTAPASEKVNSALRADFANRAQFFGRNPLIAEAMVDKDIILVQRHGKVMRLDNEDQIRKGGDDPDVMISSKGKLLTLNAEELMKFGVADMLIPPTATPPITDEELWESKWPANKVAIFHQPFFDKFSNDTIDAFTPDWRISFFTLLTHPMVSSLLFMGMFLGFYIEMSHPGFGLPGGIALCCLLLILLSSFALEAASWLEAIIVIAGLILVAVEVFVLPTFGVAGFIGIALVVGGLFSLVLPALSDISFDYDTNTLNSAGEIFAERLVYLCGALILALVIAALLGRYVMPRFANMNRLVSKGDQTGYIAGPDPKKLPQTGARGVVAATLRPSGKITINDTLYDAVSSGGFIERGTEIRVLKLDGSKIVVVSTEEEDMS
ncbi:MAG: NfeD family protein [Chlamydiales bacterium]|nr:NfeD family protein [Chlamydiales bacterium]